MWIRDRHTFNGGGLSRTVCAKQPEYHAAFHRQAQAVNRPEGAIGFGKLFHLDYLLHIIASSSYFYRDKDSTEANTGG